MAHDVARMKVKLDGWNWGWFPSNLVVYFESVLCLNFMRFFTNSRGFDDGKFQGEIVASLK